MSKLVPVEQSYRTILAPQNLTAEIAKVYIPMVYHVVAIFTVAIMERKMTWTPSFCNAQSANYSIKQPHHVLILPNRIAVMIDAKVGVISMFKLLTTIAEAIQFAKMVSKLKRSGVVATNSLMKSHRPVYIP